MRSGSVAKATGSSFSATSRCSFVSRARQTSPIPPAPGLCNLLRADSRAWAQCHGVVILRLARVGERSSSLCRRVIVRLRMR